MAVCMLPVLHASAQPRLKTAEMYAGLHGGFLASSMNWKPAMNTTAMLFGGNGGVVFRYNNLKYCGIQVELNYMQRGWKEKISASVSATGTSGTHYRRLDCIELPVLMHLYVGNEHWRGFLNAGPQIGYCLHDVSAGAQNKNVTAQYEPVYYPFDWGIAVGLGLYYRHRKAGVFQLEGRFNYSFSDVFDHSREAYFSQPHALNISANVGYFWEIKKHKERRK
jgi:hypothetical protein